MIGKTNAGGGGKIKDTNAILTATVSTGSTVTMTKGGVTLTPTMWVQAADSTLDCALFVIPASMFDSRNAWTVTATLGTDTASNTVTIDSAKQYDVSLTYNIYLIRNGVLDSNVNATFGSTSGAKSGNNYVITSEGSGSDNYCWLSISSSLGEIESCPTLAADISGMTTVDYDVVFALVDTNDDWSQGSDHVMAYTSIAASSSFPTTINLDVSSLTVTNQYVRFTIPFNTGHSISISNLYFKRRAV